MRACSRRGKQHTPGCLPCTHYPAPTSAGGDGILGVELYSLALYLFAHFYLREAHKAETADVWPSEYFSWQQEPSSPMRMTARSWGRSADASPSHKAHLPMMRQHLQQHLQLQEALVSGFSGFVARHAGMLLSLVQDPPPRGQGSGGAVDPPGEQLQLGLSDLEAAPHGTITAAELDRLSFLLRPAGLEDGQAGRSRTIEGGSPMDVCPTPFSLGAGAGIAEHTPFFAPGSGMEYCALDAVALWLADTLRPADEALRGPSPGAGDDASDMMMLGTSPPRNSVFNRLVQVSSLACPTDVHGASRTTVVRGEEDFPAGRLRILDCHDAVVYALAPLQYCLLTACSDCVVVLGAVGRVLRVERCERVQVRSWRLAGLGRAQPAGWAGLLACLPTHLPVPTHPPASASPAQPLRPAFSPSPVSPAPRSSPRRGASP